MPPFTFRWIHRATRKRLIRLIAPTLIVFSKFDIWPNLVWKASQHGIPIIVVAGTLHAASKTVISFSRKPFFRSVHQHIRVHCAISEGDAARFQELCFINARDCCPPAILAMKQVYRRATAVASDTDFFPGQATLGRGLPVSHIATKRPIPYRW